jgi:hypothetical protein
VVLKYTVVPALARIGHVCDDMLLVPSVVQVAVASVIVSAVLE